MRKLLLVLLTAAVVTAAPTPAFAGCFTDFQACMYEAAKHDSWFDRWLAGLDCELDLIECTRIKLIGI